MERVIEAALLECLREVHANRDVRLGNADAVVQSLLEIDVTINRTLAKSCINGHLVAQEQRSKIALAALQLLRARKESVIQVYCKRAEKRVASLLEEVLTPQTRAIDLIFQNWRLPLAPDLKRGKTGIYQLFRRYKPARENGPGEIAADDLRHVVVCELVYANYEALECVLITSELNVYFGALFINNEQQLHGLLQRNRGPAGVNQRIVMSRLEEAELPLYSGFCTKTGDTTRRPIASEVFYLDVPENEHPELYREMKALYGELKRISDDKIDHRVAAESVLALYLTDNPPITPYDRDDQRWKRVRFVKDFPALAKRAAPDRNGAILFREPARTLSMDQLVQISGDPPVLQVFRQDRVSSLGPRTTP
jgi:hypothetical protein